MVAVEQEQNLLGAILFAKVGQIHKSVFRQRFKVSVSEPDVKGGRLFIQYAREGMQNILACQTIVALNDELLVLVFHKSKNIS